MECRIRWTPMGEHPFVYNTSGQLSEAERYEPTRMGRQ